jgi:hypothetical protein
VQKASQVGYNTNYNRIISKYLKDEKGKIFGEDWEYE